MKENRVSVKKLEWTAYLKDLSNKMSQINFSGIANTNFHWVYVLSDAPYQETSECT